MRKIFFGIFFSICFFLPSVAFAEEINNYHVSFSVQTDGKIFVTENIHYDFGEEGRHGIFREIPVRYGSIFSPRILHVTIDSVEDDRGLDYRYTVRSQGDHLVVKIGDENDVITGAHEYVIRYTVDNALNFFRDHDELYWNVVGDAWPVIIRKADADVFLHGVPLDGDIRMSCFTGISGSTAADCVSSLKENAVHIETNVAYLKPGEGFTIVVGWPHGIITGANLSTKIDFWLAAYGWVIATIFIPLGVFCFLLWRWFRLGRDPKEKKTLVPQYEPPDGLNPLEVGTLFDFRADARDITALFFDLAVRGYMKIRYISKVGVFGHEDYEFVKLKEPTSLTKICEHDLFDALFGATKTVRLSVLKNTFYKRTKDLKDHVYDTLAMEDYFYKDPAKVRTNYYVFSFIFLFFALVVFFTPYPTYALALIISALLIAMFASFMPARTKKGVLALRHILGFRWYLRVAEKERIRFHNAPAKKPEQFEKWLAFAVVFGVEKEWAEQFALLHVPPPGWYEDPSGRYQFTPLHFVTALHGLSQSFGRLTAHNAAASGSSGFSGGSSGGGFGGGGGGSW